MLTYEEINEIMLRHSRERAAEFTNRIIENHPFMCLNGMFVNDVHNQLGLCYLQAVLDLWTELYVEDLAEKAAMDNSLPKN